MSGRGCRRPWRCVLVKTGGQIELLVRARDQTLLPPQGCVRLERSSEPGCRIRQVEPAAAPGERVVDQHDESPPGDFTGRGAAGVPAAPQSGRPRMGFVPELDQLLTAHRPHTTVAVHPQGGREIAGHAGRAQQPRRGVRSVAHRPAQPSDVHAIDRAATLVDDHRCRAAADATRGRRPMRSWRCSSLRTAQRRVRLRASPLPGNRVGLWGVRRRGHAGFSSGHRAFPGPDARGLTAACRPIRYRARL